MTAVMPDRDTCRAEVQRSYRRLPAAPLVALVDAHGGFTECAEQARYLSALARAWERAKADGSLTWVAADVLAVKLLGMHPMLVWGEDWLKLLWRLDNCGQTGGDPVYKSVDVVQKVRNAPYAVPDSPYALHHY